MTVTYEDFQDAVAAYWDVKGIQQELSVIKNKVGAGTAGSVRAGQQFNGVAALLAKFFVDAGYPPEAIRISGRAALALPGYYRPHKMWDVVVTYQGILVAAFELKALGAGNDGSSFGRNYNNRVEEALGSAADLRRAELADLYPREKPWLGYFFLMEDASTSRRHLKINEGPIPVERTWIGKSYQDRLGIFCERLLDERIYDAVCYITSSKDDPGPKQPVESADWTHFSAAIKARITYLEGLGYPDPLGTTLL